MAAGTLGSLCTRMLNACERPEHCSLSILLLMTRPAQRQKSAGMQFSSGQTEEQPSICIATCPVREMKHCNQLMHCLHPGIVDAYSSRSVPKHNNTASLGGSRYLQAQHPEI